MLKTLHTVTFSLIAVLIAVADALAAVAVDPVPVPEPSTLVLMASGVAGAILYARNRRSRK